MTEQCLRGADEDILPYRFEPKVNDDEEPPVGLVLDGRSSDGSPDFALAPRVTATERASNAAETVMIEVEHVAAAVGRTYCFANLGAFCMQGDWDTAPCRNDYPRDCFPKTPEMNEEDRAALMAVIDDAVARLPGDDFIVGQAIYANVKFRRPIRTTVVLRNCRASEWWCAALEGFVHHHADRPLVAELAFLDALRMLPEELRCDWSDLRELLNYGDRGPYRDYACGEERDEVNRMLWWVSDPLFIQPGNDRFAEQMSRNVGRILHSQLADIMGGRHQPRHDTLVERYGFEDSYQFPGWDRIPALCCGLTHPSAPFSFIPDLSAALDPGSSVPENWEIGYQDQVEGYAWWGRFFVDLPYQAAFFQRGDSALALVASDVERQASLTPWDYSAGVYLAEGPNATEHILLDSERKPTYRWSVPVAAAPHLFSVEAIVPEQGAARARFGQAPPFLEHEDGVAVSDLLVYRPSGFEPRSAEDALALAYGRTQLRADEDLALYFEVYGAEADELTTFRLEVVEERSGVLSAVGGALGLSGPDGLRLEWTAPAEPDEDLVWPNALDIDLSELETGEYTFELQVSVGGLRPRVVRRTVFIVEE